MAHSSGMFSLIRHIGSCLVLLSALSAAALAESTPAVVTIKSDPLTRSGFDHYYNAEYDKAIHDFEKTLEAHPDDPAAVNHLLAAVMFKELYRLGALDTSLYSNNSFLDHKKKFPVDPKVKARVQELSARAQKLEEARLEQDPKDVQALYARGVTRSMNSTYTALVEKAWMEALGNAKGSRSDHEEVLKLDPTFSDAKTVVGTHEYIAGSLPWAVRMLAHLVGFGGNKEKGLQLLREAGDSTGETSVDAKVILTLFLRREQRFDEALGVIRSLNSAHNRNFLFALEEANILKDAGKGPESITAYRKVLTNAKAGAYTDPHIELGYWGLGEALKGQRDFAGAAEAYETVRSFPRADDELVRRANLAAGEMYDQQQKRDQATEKYNAVIASSGDSPEAGKARHYLHEPFRMP